MPRTALPTATKYVLAIDLGGGGPKAILFSERGELVASASRRISTFLTADGGGEQDPEEWWSSITAAVQELTFAGHVPVDDILAVACATQWSVTVPVDAAGRALMNAVHWTDSRGARYTKQITDGLIKISGYGVWRLIHWLRMTGGAPTHSGADALAHMLFIKHERPDVYHQTDKLLEPMDYINYRLTGRCIASYGTVFPYFLTDNRNPNRIEYNSRLIEWSGIDREKLPDLAPVDHMIGPLRPEVAEAWGLSRGTQVMIGINDSQAAVLGSGAVQDYEGHVCIGTTAWMTCHVPFKKTHLSNYIATMPAALPGRNMIVAEQGAAGKCLESLVDNWFFPNDELTLSPRSTDVYERLEGLIERIPPGSEELIFLPWLGGAGPPSGDADIRGGFLNQNLRHGRGHAARAVMEGVAYNLKWLMTAIEPFTGHRFQHLNFIGGGARSRVWCQTMADVLDRPIHQMAEPSMAIARGAALAALLALGRLTVVDFPRAVKIAEIFEPRRETRAIYDKLFAALLNSYKANRRLFHALNRKR